ncbi:MAG: MFS transporter, partial [Chloroflexota bacterium]
MTQRRTIVITAGLMLSLFLVSMESTVVSTAMPTIVSQLGGLEAYSWVFTAFMLASTTTVPLYGKLSDLYGRRPVYAVAMVIFLLGSVLCGTARSMPQLIAFRTIQGIGGGGLLPLVFIIIGDLFTL